MKLFETARRQFERFMPPDSSFINNNYHWEILKVRINENEPSKGLATQQHQFLAMHQ